MTQALKRMARLHTGPQWIAFGVVAALLLVVIPALQLGPEPGAPIYLSDHLVPLFGKFLCYALVAIAMDLVWGYCGILSLGHGVFFAIGGYAMGMYLMRSIGREGVYRSDLPDFMVFLDWKELPWYWQGFENFPFAALMVVAAPGLLALCFGYLAFRSKIRGVYFSIITQALTYALMLLMFRNETGFGGNNGLTDFKRVLDYPIAEQSTKLALYFASALALVGGYLLCRFVVTSKLGRVLVAIRDQESRVTFAGYDPLRFKLFAWTLSAMLCGVAGALYVPQVGIINPSELAPANSIEIAIWVAIGGRGTLAGAALGALVVNAGKSWLTAAFPELWLYFLGLLFVVVTLLLPEGLLGLTSRLRRAPKGTASSSAEVPSLTKTSAESKA